MPTESPRLTRAWRTSLVGLALAAMALPAAALYKVVGPDGRVTYTDRPPSDGSARVSTLGRDAVNEVPAAQANLPQELRAAATRFPVTLYSAADCAPCDAGRQLLVQRGVPFTERLIVSEDDAAAMERVLGARTVPGLTIGSQVLRGLTPADWSAYLDAAGYPRESRLPGSWQAPAATTLVVRRSAGPTPAPRPAASAPARSAPAPAPSIPVVPAGGSSIRF
jgi:glutaredoxin